jgi:hypothetical protein
MSKGPTLTLNDAKARAGHRSTLELVAVMLLGIATVATAWCGYQSSQWNGRETEESRAGTLQRIEASRLYNLAVQKVAYDANTTGQYAQAISEKNTALATFIRTNLVRPAFLPFLDEWEAEVRAGDGSATNVFENKAYLDAQFADSTKATELSDASLALSAAASKHGQDYLIATLLTATALFFAGVTTSFKSSPARMALATVAAILLVIVALRLANLPVA